MEFQVGPVVISLMGILGSVLGLGVLSGFVFASVVQVTDVHFRRVVALGVLLLMLGALGPFVYLADGGLTNTISLGYAVVEFVGLFLVAFGIGLLLYNAFWAAKLLRQRH